MRRANTFSEIVKATGREYAIQESDGIIRLTLDGKPLDDDPADCDCENIEEAEKYYSRYLMEHVVPKDKRYLMHGRWLLKPDVVYELGDMMDDDTIVSYPSASAIIRELERLASPRRRTSFVTATPSTGATTKSPFPSSTFPFRPCPSSAPAATTS